MIRILAAFLLAFLLAQPAFAQSASPWVATAESYMQNLKEAKADFQLIAPDNSMRSGTFFLKRPGRLRFEYNEAPYDLIVADGTLLHFYDAYSKQTQSAPIAATLANFFLRSSTKLSGDVRVKDVREDGGYVHLDIVQAKDPNAGLLTLSFGKQPFVLKGWRVAEGTGNVTRVRLRNLQENPHLPAALFNFKDPSGKGRVNQ